MKPFVCSSCKRGFTLYKNALRHTEETGCTSKVGVTIVESGVIASQRQKRHGDFDENRANKDDNVIASEYGAIVDRSTSSPSDSVVDVPLAFMYPDDDMQLLSVSQGVHRRE